jgi:DNA-directed RNA polymerase specialized sigma24 family protein
LRALKRIALTRAEHQQQQTFIVGFEPVQTSFYCTAEVKMVSPKQVKHQTFATRTESADFCRIFEQDMDRLYLLSFLLTGDEDLAERCFVGGLEDSAKGPRVFKEWAHSWARRMVIQNAIQIMRPQTENNRVPNHDADCGITSTTEISAVAQLPAFERFVFVMSVLECYSDQDCALLLDCTRSEVDGARIHALQQIGSSGGKHSSSAKPVPEEVTALALIVDSIPHLATSA